MYVLDLLIRGRRVALVVQNGSPEIVQRFFDVRAFGAVSPVLHGIEHGLAEDRVGNVRHQLLDVRDLHGIFGGFRRHARSDGQAKRKAQRGAYQQCANLHGVIPFDAR